MQRHMQTVGVLPEKRDEYLALHRAVWPKVEARLRASNVSNYSIFILGDTLYAYFEYIGADLASDMAAVAADPVTREWWSLTDPCQSPFAAAASGEVWAEATEVWHLA